MIFRQRIPLAVFGALAVASGSGAAPARPALTNAGYQLLNQRAVADPSKFYVFQDTDSGLNHGFPSGFFGAVTKVAVDTGCVDDPSAASGCSKDPRRLDELKGTVLQVKFAPQAPGVFSGVDFEEPHGYVASPRGNGYDLIGSRRILFAFRSPTGIVVQFGAGGTTTPWLSLPKSASYQTGCIALSEIAALACPSTAAVKAKLSGAIALKSVHILFTVTTNDKHAPGGGVVLLDNIVYDPVPIRQQSAISLPLSTQTFGIAPLEQAGSGRVPFPPDQVNRNIASLYEASLGIIALLARAEGDDVHNALAIADALIYALGHDNQGDPLPVAADHATGLHNAYKSGDLDLLNSQGPGAGQAGQIQFAGFSIAPKGKCGAAGFCIVLDGATGGNNAFAVLALLKAHRKTGQPRYLNAALDIGNWIDEELLDPTGTGYGGYFLGYPDQGQKKVLQTSKSTENNADIFAAFTALAAAEQALGHPGQANKWTARAKIAGDFAISMLDRSRSCFFGGTVPHGTRAGPGIDPTGTRRGAEVINRSDFLDSNSFTYLALSSSAQYRSAADWSKVVKCLGQFRTSVKAAGATFSGYDLVRSPIAGPNGVAWEFTGQAAVVIGLSGGNPTSVIDAMRTAQALAPFADRKGLVAATLALGDSLAPRDQCLSTPFQCIPERIGLAATVWGIFAEKRINPFR